MWRREAGRWFGNRKRRWCFFSFVWRMFCGFRHCINWVLMERRKNRYRRKGNYLFHNRWMQSRFNSIFISSFSYYKIQISPWDAFKSEISFAFNVWIVSKPVRAKSSEIVSRKSTPPRSLKSRSRYGSESRSLKNKSTRSLNFDDAIHDSNSRSLLNLH